MNPQDAKHRAAIDRVLKNLLQGHYETSARLDATKGVLAIFGRKLGVSEKEIETMLDQFYKNALEARLIQLENVLPWLAAELGSETGPEHTPEAGEEDRPPKT